MSEPLWGGTSEILVIPALSI